MPSAESSHLGDQEISLLVSGQGSRALRQSLSEHLLRCEPCRALVVEAMRALRTGARHPAGSPAPEAPPNPADVAAVLQAMDQAARASSAGPPGRRVIALRPESRGELRALAAEPASGSPLRTYFSPDGMMVVCIERRSSGTCLLARVSRKAGAHRGTMWLVFREPGLSFPVFDHEEIELPGVTEAHLTPAGVEIEFRG